METLYQKLVEYGETDVYPMHMPGHKRNSRLVNMVDPYQIDITEIDEFDNLQDPSGVIKNLEDRISLLYGAKRSFISVNGSSGGILAAMSACAGYGDYILMGRNCHKSVYNGAMIRGMIPVYLNPPIMECGIYGGLELEHVKQVVEKAKVKFRMAIITSPTYEGIVTDIEKIAEYLREKEIILIVDGAHGAHLGFHKCFPENPTRLGADITVLSIHKTLPAFTQTAVICLGKKSRADEVRLARFMKIYQSSSPSYILMSGVDNCINILETQGKNLFEAYWERLCEFYQQAEKLKWISILNLTSNVDNFSLFQDPGKICIFSNPGVIKFSFGQYLYDKLRNQFGIQPEMKSRDYVIALTGICDTTKGFERLSLALKQIDMEMDEEIVKQKNGIEVIEEADKLSLKKQFWKLESTAYPTKKLEIHDTLEKDTEFVPFSEAEGRICGEYLCLYPPGIPLIVPGEIFEKRLLKMLDEYIKLDFEILGMADGFVSVLL